MDRSLPPRSLVDAGRSRLTRRAFVGTSVAAAVGAGTASARPAARPTHPTARERRAMAGLAQDYMARYDVPGLSIVIAEYGTPVYARAFGVADRDAPGPLTRDHRFRIASVSKTLTATAIFQLVQAGRLSLRDRVFGPGAILGTVYGEPLYGPWVSDLEVRHLLTHTAGGWDNAGADPDPMFTNPDMDQAQLIRWTLAEMPLRHPPGSVYAYSNFGYCVLGRVIETLTGKPYDVAVRDSILGPCGITGMEIGGSTLAERRPGEVAYHSQGSDPSPYGMDLARMDSHGGWIARPIDLVRFLVHVDGRFPGRLLRPATVRAMTTGTAANPGYAKGWAVNAAHNWWHTGSLPGTATEVVRTHSRFCWGVLTNTRVPDSSTMFSDLDALPWSMAARVRSWRA